MPDEQDPQKTRKPPRHVKADPKTGHIRVQARRVHDDAPRSEAPRTSHLGESKRVKGRILQRTPKGDAAKEAQAPPTRSPPPPNRSPPADGATQPPHKQAPVASPSTQAKQPAPRPPQPSTPDRRAPEQSVDAATPAAQAQPPARPSAPPTRSTQPPARQPGQPPQGQPSQAPRPGSQSRPPQPSQPPIAQAAGQDGARDQRGRVPTQQPSERSLSRAQQAEQRDMLSGMKRQSRIRARQEAEEAKRMEQEAKELRRKASKRRQFEQDLRKHQERVASLGAELGMRPDRPVVEIPALPEGHRQVEFESFQDGMAHVRISFDPYRKEYRYEVLEPRLNGTEQEALEFLRDTLVRTLEGRHKRSDDWAEYLTGAIKEAIRDHSVLLDAISTQRVRYHLLRDFLGYGPINVLMLDPMIEDISCDGPGIPLYLFHRQYESIKTNLVLDEETQLDAFVIRLAQMSGKHISIADPILDATLPDGSRLQSTLSREVTTRGSSFTIRKFRSDPLTPPDLAHYGTMSPEMAGYFWFLMEHGMSMVIAGGTASGKTTTLNAACQFIPFQKKVVSIEDTREINLQHENWIAGVTRSGFGGEGGGGKRTGTIDMYDLLGAALRQRPEYLLVGEVRGAEALTLFQAMATGHAVYSTMHADSVQSAVYRLENEPINVPRMMLQTIDVLAVQQQVRIKDRMTRRITDVTEVVGFDAETGDLLTNTVFEWDVVNDRHHYLGKSHILERVMQKQNLTDQEVEDEWRNRVRVIEWMIHKGIRRYDEVAPVVAQYYRDPEATLAQITRDEAELHYNVDTSNIRVAPVGTAVGRIHEPEPQPEPEPDAEPERDAGEPSDEGLDDGSPAQRSRGGGG